MIQHLSHINDWFNVSYWHHNMTDTASQFGHVSSWEFISALEMGLNWHSCRVFLMFPTYFVSQIYHNDWLKIITPLDILQVKNDHRMHIERSWHDKMTGNWKQDVVQSSENLVFTLRPRKTETLVYGRPYLPSSFCRNIF